MDHSMEYTTFVLVTFQRDKEILQAIQSIMKQKGKFEIILIDNYPLSTLGNKLPITDNLKYFMQKENKGLMWARNFGAKKAKGKIIVYLDDDAEFETDDVISKINRYFEKSDDIVCLAFLIKNYFTRQIVPKEFPHPNIKYASHERLVSYYVGAGHAFRKKALTTIGPLLDTFYGAEELDMSYRLINQGYKILYTPDIIVLHKASPKGRHTHGKNIYYSLRNRYWVLGRHLPFCYFFVNTFLWSIVWFVKALFSNNLRYFLTGLLDGLKKNVYTIKNGQRIVLNKNAIAYLKQNGGRLWF